MKFAFKIGWKIGNVTADARLRVQQQQHARKNHRLWRRQYERGIRRLSQTGSNAAATHGPQKPNRKTILIKRACTEFVAQRELLQLQIDKPPKVLAKSVKEDFLHDGSFHQAVGKVLLFAEFFAIMPVKGVTAAHPRQLSFSWTNIRTLYCLLFITTTIIDLGLTMNKVLHKPINFNSVEPLIFRLSIIVVCTSAIVLARKWPALMLHWHEMECDLPEYLTQMEKGRLAYRIKMVTVVAMMLSLGEHLLNILSNIHYSHYCPQTEDPIENFFLLTNQHLFMIFPYSVPLAIWGKVQNILCTFIWNYMDVFVMIVSIGLAAKFRQLNDNLFKFKGMRMPEFYWSTRRKQYRNLCELCTRIDGAISLITMISFSNNLYFICVQLLRSLNKMSSLAHGAYFYFSFFFLIGRTLAVSLYSASINDESRKPLRVLRCVPKESWCVEVKRFSEDISTDLVALSGMKFFYLTRKMVLSYSHYVSATVAYIAQVPINVDDSNAKRKLSQKQTTIMLNEKFKKSKEVYKLKLQQHWITRGIQRGTRADFLHNGSFHQAVGPVFVIAQCFALMPVRGVLSSTPKGLSFSWLSFRTCYCLVYTLLTTACTGLTINMTIRGALEVTNISPLVFHVNALLVSIGFLCLAGKWPQLMRKWQRVERQMPPFQSWRERETLSVRVHKVTFVLITLSLTEHLLSIISGIQFAIQCTKQGDAVQSYLMAVSYQIFLVFDYSTWLAWFGKILNVFMTFGWSYMDVFLMIIGIGLSSLFGQVQNSLECVRGQVMPESYWTRTRLQYRLICDLIEQVDSAIAAITLLSFANNLFFVCIQLLRSINKMTSPYHFIYFYASLSFLLGRTLAVSLYLSEVNERAREPLGIIKQVPKEGYNAEVDRFGHEVAVDTVALTGLQYFNVTRGLVLTVAGTIVTYELVFIQFQKEDNLWKCG